MDRQARTYDTVLVRSREMAGRSQNTAVVAVGGEGVKTTDSKLHCPHGRRNFKDTSPLMSSSLVILFGVVKQFCRF